MNIGGHIAVARVLGTDSVTWLGAALPDIAAMGRFNLLGDSPTGALAQGVNLHHRTDDVFHSHSWFRTRQSALFATLTASGVSRGAARAVAHVGPELLLDGQLLSDEATRRDVTVGMNHVGERLDEIQTLVRAEHRQSWRQHLIAVAQRRSPTDLNDPFAVAELLGRILARRPRLHLEISQVSVVGSILAEAQSTIVAGAEELVIDVAASVGRISTTGV